MKKIDFRILFFWCFFRIPHTKISLLVNFYINLIIFRYFFSGSNMCHNTYKNVYAFFAKSCYFLEQLCWLGQWVCCQAHYDNWFDRPLLIQWSMPALKLFTYVASTISLGNWSQIFILVYDFGPNKNISY
jgi:hypothetical protein